MKDKLLFLSSKGINSIARSIDSEKSVYIALLFFAGELNIAMVFTTTMANKRKMQKRSLALMEATV